MRIHTNRTPELLRDRELLQKFVGARAVGFVARAADALRDEGLAISADARP